MKIINSNPEAVILSAVQKYINFIAPTYGPAGKKILIVQNEFNHEAVDDGKRASASFEIENEFENAVAQYIKETTLKGKDGTTTAVLLMGNIVGEAFKDLDDELRNNDYHGMALALRRGLDEAIKKIQKASKQIKTKDELYAVAYNSYKNPEIAELIADTVFKIGKDGVMAIEDSQTTTTSVEVVNGLEINKGYLSPYFITDLETERVVLSEPKFLLVNKKINSLMEILPLFTTMQATPQGNRPVFDTTSPVVIAEGFGEELVNKLIMLRATGQLSPLLIEIPHSSNKLETLKDIAVIIGAKAIDNKVTTLEQADKTYLGSATSLTSTKDKTKILGGAGKKGEIKEYVETIKALNPTNPHEKDQQTKRVAQLSGGIAVIKLGAYTDNELKSKKTKVENAINSAQLAFKGGVVPGAGKMFLDIETSSDLLNKALKAPRKQLELNGKQYLDENTTDPTEVLITALTTAVSIAEGLITMGGISANKRKRDMNGNVE